MGAVKHIRRTRMTFWLVFLCAGMATVGTQSGYLTVLGPAPLRFIKQSQLSALKVLGPLLMKDPELDSANTSVSGPGGDTPDTGPGKSAEDPFRADTSVQKLTGTSTNQFEQAAPPPVVVSNAPPVLGPEILTDLFKPTLGVTNGMGRTIYMPLPFIPPGPAKPSSSATYRQE